MAPAILLCAVFSPEPLSSVFGEIVSAEPLEIGSALLFRLQTEEPARGAGSTRSCVQSSGMRNQAEW
ncbi:MAG: hypothetical protein CSB33_03340 [Desulfobacterales bacterium]|nr:MAG: hypothetical protein CSB33_03340 [Desulfobacterales bacterium]